jgi:hypothetical protein
MAAILIVTAAARLDVILHLSVQCYWLAITEGKWMV